MSQTASLDNPSPDSASNKITVRFLEVTPPMATAWLEKNTDNRSMRTDAVDAYSRDLAEGRWKVTGEAIKFDWNGRLIDGQHRLAGLARAGVSQWMLIVEGLDPEVQRVIDVNVKRSAGDQLRLLGVTTNVFSLASTARLAILRERGHLNTMGSAKYTVSHAEIFEWVEAHPDAAENTAYAMRVYQQVGAAPSPLAYTMWRLAQINLDEMVLFFDTVANAATEGKGDARLALIRMLAHHRSTAAGRRAGTQIGLIFTAWNAWRAKEELHSIAIIDGKGSQLPIPEPK